MGVGERSARNSQLSGESMRGASWQNLWRLCRLRLQIKLAQNCQLNWGVSIAEPKQLLSELYPASPLCSSLTHLPTACSGACFAACPTVPVAIFHTLQLHSLFPSPACPTVCYTVPLCVQLACQESVSLPVPLPLPLATRLPAPLCLCLSVLFAFQPHCALRCLFAFLSVFSAVQPTVRRILLRSGSLPFSTVYSAACPTVPAAMRYTVHPIACFPNYSTLYSWFSLYNTLHRSVCLSVLYTSNCSTVSASSQPTVHPVAPLYTQLLCNKVSPSSNRLTRCST